MAGNQGTSRFSPSSSSQQNNRGSLRGRGSTNRRGGLMSARGGFASNPYVISQAISNHMQPRQVNRSQASSSVPVPKDAQAPKDGITTVSTGMQTLEIASGDKVDASGQDEKGNKTSDGPTISCNNCIILRKRIVELEALVQSNHKVDNASNAATSADTDVSNLADAFEKGVEPFRHMFGDFVMEIRRISPESQAKNDKAEPAIEEQSPKMSSFPKDTIMSESTEPTTLVPQESKGKRLSASSLDSPMPDIPQLTIQDMANSEVPVTTKTVPRTDAHTDATLQRSSRLPPNLPLPEQRSEKGMGSLPKTDMRTVKASLDMSQWAGKKFPSDATSDNTATSPEQSGRQTPTETQPGKTSVMGSRWATGETDASSPLSPDKRKPSMGRSKWPKKTCPNGKKW
ncbi:uncharacterized protein K452DRAFT_301557 [Aplosporella prunicola CBS 121167]|uniref:Uncharacterized protein n=1 Tax=Aplosporella prunicola CBS 121167 TaxID=1176127 RepID=A0A6A6B1Y5_9PEZI|nr:uncharacterized protein K452DRAFT_301557 [Aplosporella prunicola CBS 121167]KAF2137826.1 hypothetical protein K452DRAFT_301557 [Aplosporella prunicola CBS 121167]